MRTYNEILLSYVGWYYKKTKDKDYNPTTFLSCPERELAYRKAYIWKNIMDLCYDKEFGIFWFWKFILGDMKYAGYPEPIKFNSLWLEWTRLIRQGDHITIECARQHGKCLSGNTLVTTHSGMQKKIKDLSAGDEILSFNEKTQQIEEDIIVHKECVGSKKAYRIKTKSGREIYLASTHPLYTKDGWKQVSELHSNDYIACPLSIPVGRERTITIEEAELLGWVISEGYYGRRLQITQKDMACLDRILNVSGKGSKIYTYQKRASVVTVPLRNFRFKELRYKNSYEKFIPGEVFSQQEDIKYAFLSSLIEGDGYINTRENGDNNIIYCTVSERLAHDVQYLLQMLGINSIIKTRQSCRVIKKLKKRVPVYLVKINGKNALTLMQNTKFISKENDRKLLVYRLEKLHRNEKLDVIPKELINKYCDKKLFNNWSRERLMARIGHMEKILSGTTRIRKDYKEKISNDDIISLKRVSGANIYWDAIESIVELDNEEMYDIQVLKNHNYIANGLYSHNSSYFTVIVPIYRTAMFDNYNVLIESATEEQAVSLLGYITRIILNNEFLASRVAKNTKWSTEEISYNGGKIVARGAGSEIRGGTFDYIACDDILRSDNKYSDEDMENFVFEELEPMILVRHGQIVIVGTRKSVTDIFSAIERMVEEGSSAWILRVYPAILDWDKQILLCPDRFTWDQLMNKLAVMGRMKFDKEFLCKVCSSGSQLFPNELIERAREKGRDIILANRCTTIDERFWRYFVGVDCSRAGTASADYTVVTVLAYNPQTQVKKICWIWREKGLKISEQVSHIAEIAKNFNYPVVLVERNNIGQDFIDMLVDNYNLHVEAFTTGAKGQSKEDLIRFLINAFEHEKLILPQGDEFSREVISDLIKELSRFVIEITKAGNEVMKGSGHSHDDMVMSLALANKCSQYFGYEPFVSYKTSKKNTTELERFASSENIMDILKLGKERVK